MRTKNVVLVTLLSLVLGFSLSAQSADDWYFNKPIRQITFDGLKSVDRSEMDGLFGTYLGKPFNDERYWEILQKLYALEYFDDVSPVALPQKGNSIMQLVLFSCSLMPWTGVTNGVNCNMTSGSIPFQEVLRCTFPRTISPPPPAPSSASP